MRSVVAVVIGLRPGDGESTVENVLEAEYRAVGEREILERRGRIRVEMIEARQLHRPSVYISVPKPAECPIVSGATVDNVRATDRVIAVDFRVGERHLEDGSPLQHGARDGPIESRDIERAITIEIVVATAADDHVVAG